MQERIPGVGLNVAWRYLSSAEKRSFKSQAREVLKALYTIKASSDAPNCGLGYVVPDPDPVTNRGIQALERDILFANKDAAAGTDDVYALLHNDLSQSNLIVDQGKIVAVVDWEMAGFFTWAIARDVHLRIRSPSRETYAHLNLPRDVLEDIYFWNDLYD